MENRQEGESNRFERWHGDYQTHARAAFITTVLVGLGVLVSITILQKGVDTSTLHRFWLNQGVKYSTICLVQVVCGLIVTHYDVKVNYTRKIVHMFYFLVPQLLDTEILPFQKNVYTELWNIVIIFCALILIIEPFRKRINLFSLMFKAIDRPEDRPYTVFWFITQLAASIPIIACFSLVFDYYGKSDYVFIPILVLTIGDGLAEPVGTRFGKHKYTVRGFLVKTEYTRSIEGSMCVYLTSLASVLLYYNDFNKASLAFALASMPILLTLTEAKSPHTWDNPLILLVGYLLLLGAHGVS